MNIVCMMSSLQLGGAERQMLGLANVLQEAGHKVEILTYHKAAFYSPLTSEYSLNHTYIERQGCFVGFLHRVAKHLDDFSCDAIISFKAGCSIKACLLKYLRPGLSVFVSERNMNLSYRPHDAFRFFVFKHCAEKVVCNNHSQEEFIRKHFPSLGDKLVTVSNFVDMDCFYPIENEQHTPRIIIVTARISARKNMEGLILAAEILKRRSDVPPFKIDWYGMSRQSRYLRRMLKLIHSKRLGDVFRIHSATGEVVDRYRESDILCLPSFYEGTSNSIAEALACGKVVVCSNVSDNPLYVQDGVDGFLCDPHSPISIADTLAKALKMSDKEMTEAGIAGSAIVREKLSLERFRNEYLRLFQFN